LNSPFDEQKYKRLLEGLEVSEISLVDLREKNRTFRMDSTFFNKRIYVIDLFIKGKPHFFLQEKEIVSGPFGSTLTSHAYLNSGIPFIRIENIRGGFNINTSEMIYISENNNRLLKNSQLFVDDLILFKVGNTIGYYARVDEGLKQCNISENNLGIKLSKYNTYLKHYILTYLNSKIGYDLTIRRISGNAQPKLNVFDISEIPIPIFSDNFYRRISDYILESKINITQSQQLYRKAEELLLETIGLKDFKPSQERKNIKSFKESFFATGRLDAEYYQPKYEETIAKIKEQQYDLLGNLVTIKKSIEPGSDVYGDEGLPFARVSDYNKFGVCKPEKKLIDSFCKDNQDLIEKLKPKKETILFSKDGSVGIAYMLRKDGNFVTSGALLHLNVKDKKRLLPEYLTLVLNSQIIQMQAERDAGGSIILHWHIDEIEQVVVPVVDYNIQQQIADLIGRSFTLRRDSERLLEDAKEIVEREIEGTIKT
jgi:restriction endonuclease S subunit